KSDSLRRTSFDRIKCFFEPVADEIDPLGDMLIVSGAQASNVLVAQFTQQFLVADERRVADYHIGIWPLRRYVANDERVATLDLIQGLEDGILPSSLSVLDHPLQLADPHGDARQLCPVL